MKRNLNAALIGISVCLSLSACNVMTGMHDTANERYTREQNRNKAEQQRESTAFAGGEPGKISVNGAAVQNNQLDNRIQVIQQYGTSERLKMVSMVQRNNDDASTLRSYSNAVSTKTQTQRMDSDKTYVRIGCDQLTPSWIAELTEAKPQQQGDSYVINANTVIVCGKIDLSSAKIMISAHHLYLSDAIIKQQAGPGSLTVIVDKVFLEGKNKLETLGLDATSNVAPAASLEINISQGVFGDGSLKLQSQGGNCKNP